MMNYIAKLIASGLEYKYVQWYEYDILTILWGGIGFFLTGLVLLLIFNAKRSGNHKVRIIIGILLPVLIGVIFYRISYDVYSLIDVANLHFV